MSIIQCRNTTTIFDERKRPIISFYSYSSEIGKDLQKFITELIMEDDYTGMGDLAARVIREFKAMDNTGLYIIDHELREKLYYEIRCDKNNKVSLTCTDYLTDKTLKFPLYEDDVKPKERVVFKYYKDGSTQFRDVLLIEENDVHIIGLDSDDKNRFKKFCKKNIRGGILREKL